MITITTNIKSFEETAYYEVYVDDNLVTNTLDFTLKNTKDFCYANNETKCSTSDLSGTTIYEVCYQCASLNRGDPCDPTLCCDHPDQITPKAVIPDEEFQINPEAAYPG